MNINEMSFDDFDFDFDAPNPSTPKVERFTLRAYTKAYYEWIKPKAKKLIASVKKLAEAKGRICPSCQGSGKYVGVRYTRDCITCKVDGVSLGHMTDSSERRLTAYAERKSSGQPMRENTHGNNWTFA